MCLCVRTRARARACVCAPLHSSVQSSDMITGVYVFVCVHARARARVCVLLYHRLLCEMVWFLKACSF